MLNQAARIRPESPMTHYYLGLSYSALGAFAEAEKVFHDLLPEATSLSHEETIKLMVDGKTANKVRINIK